MFNSVLVPLDGSAIAEHALPLASTLARCAGCELRLVRVVPPLGDTYFWAPLPGDPLEVELREAQRTQARAYLDDVVHRLREAGASCVTCAVMEDVVPEKESVSEAIRADVLKTGADLVVMTSHGRGPIARFWLGSIADKLVRTLHVPVLLVRPAEDAPAPDLKQGATPKHLLLALDGTSLAEGIVEPALAIGKAVNADYTLVRVIQPAWPLSHPLKAAGSLQEPSLSWDAAKKIDERNRQNAESYLETVAKRLRADGASVQTRIHFAEQPAAAILTEAVSVGANLIALETHGRGGLSRLLMGSVADKVVRGSSIPVLVCRQAQ